MVLFLGAILRKNGIVIQLIHIKLIKIPFYLILIYKPNIISIKFTKKKQFSVINLMDPALEMDLICFLEGSF